MDIKKRLQKRELECQALWETLRDLYNGAQQSYDTRQMLDVLAVRALDPTDLTPLPHGRDGVLAFFDLANLGSICHVLTEDVGSVHAGGVRLRGRSVGAEPRGCSRAMDDLMSAARG